MALDFVAITRREGETLAAAARARSLDALVPSCPGWDAHALLAHTSGVHRWAAGAILNGGGAPGRFPKAPEDRAAVLGWFEEGLDIVVAALAATQPEAPSWTFMPQDQTAAFWHRRMAQETLVHRWDLQAAFGVTTSIDPELASDGIDELMVVHAPRRLSQVEGGITTEGTIHVHCTDAAGEWTFSSHGDSFTMTRGHTKGDVALRGPAGEVLLVLWGRRSIDAAAVEVIGEAPVLQRWLAPGMP